MKALPTLYHKARTGGIHSWKIWTEGPDKVTEHGLVTGKKQVDRVTCEAKNVGKKNATTAKEQAELEAKAMHKYRLDRKYSLTEKKAQDTVLLPMLAKKFEDRKKKNVVYPGSIQPKLDGVRALARWVIETENTGHTYKTIERVELVSRNGKQYNCPHITAELERVMPKNMVLDGELYVHEVGFQTVSSWIKKLQKETKQIIYNVYDAPESDNRDDLSWIDRLKVLDRMAKVLKDYKTEHLAVVPTYSVPDEKAAYKYQEKFVSEGYEGAIFRNDAGLYQYGYRSDDLLKIKTFDDAEFEIVGYTDGKGRDKGTVIWICKTPGGDVFNVRSKGEYTTRKQWFAEGQVHVGKMLKVKYFGMSDEKIPRFPVGLGFRLEEDQ